MGVSSMHSTPRSVLRHRASVAAQFVAAVCPCRYVMTAEFYARMLLYKDLVDTVWGWNEQGGGKGEAPVVRTACWWTSWQGSRGGWTRCWRASVSGSNCTTNVEKVGRMMDFPKTETVETFLKEEDPREKYRQDLQPNTNLSDMTMQAPWLTLTC